MTATMLLLKAVKGMQLHPEAFVALRARNLGGPSYTSRQVLSIQTESRCGQLDTWREY